MVTSCYPLRLFKPFWQQPPTSSPRYQLRWNETCETYNSINRQNERQHNSNISKFIPCHFWTSIKFLDEKWFLAANNSSRRVHRYWRHHKPGFVRTMTDRHRLWVHHQHGNPKPVQSAFRFCAVFGRALHDRPIYALIMWDDAWWTEY